MCFQHFFFKFVYVVNLWRLISPGCDKTMEDTRKESFILGLWFKETQSTMAGAAVSYVKETQSTTAGTACQPGRASSGSLGNSLLLFHSMVNPEYDKAQGRSSPHSKSPQESASVSLATYSDSSLTLPKQFCQLRTKSSDTGASREHFSLKTQHCRKRQIKFTKCL